MIALRIRQAWELLREIWSRNRWGLSLSLIGMPLLLAVAHGFVASYPEFDRWLGTVHLAAVWSVMIVVVIFAYVDFSTRNLEVGFPQHVLRLPAPTVLLVSVPLVSATILVWLQSMALIMLSREQWLPVRDAGWLMLISLAAVSWMQAISWGLSRTPVRAALLLIMALVAGGVCALSVLSIGPAPLLPAWLGSAGLIGMAVGGAVLAYLAVARERCGRAVGRRVIWSDLTVPGFSLPQRLETGRQAQFWYEWRVFGWIFPLGTLLFAVLIVFSQWLPGNLEDRIEATSVSLVMFLYVASVLGFELSKSHFGAPDHEMSAFWAVRPLSTAALAHAKLKVAVWSLLIGAVLCLGPVYPAWILGGHGDEVAVYFAQAAAQFGTVGTAVMIAAVALAIPVLSWVICGSALAVTLRGAWSKKRLLAGGVLIIIALAALTRWVSNSELLSGWLLEHAVECVAVLGGLALGALTPLISRYRRSHATALLVRPALVIGAIALAFLLGSLSLLESPRVALLLAATVILFASLSMMPWLLGPMALSQNRHR